MRFIIIIITIDMIVQSTLDYSVSQETDHMYSTVFIPVGCHCTACLHKLKLGHAHIMLLQTTNSH